MTGINIIKIEEYGYNIFDFDYTWSDVNYLGEQITKETLEQEFKDYYAYYDIAYETIESFKFELRRRWKKLIAPLNLLLQSEPQITYDEGETQRNETINSEDNATRQTTNNTTTDETSENDRKFSDTPNQPMTGGTSYLTNRSIDNSTRDSTTNATGSTTDNDKYEATRDTTETKRGNLYEKYISLRDKYINMLYEFFDKFNDMFSNIYQIDDLTRRFGLWMIR